MPQPFIHLRARSAYSLLQSAVHVKTLTKLAARHEMPALGLTDAVRSCTDAPGVYSFWDYQAGAFQRNNGIRIDHLLLSPQATDRIRSTSIRKDVRGWEKPSDHVPVLVDLEFE